MYGAPDRSVGVKEVVERLLPGVRELLLGWTIYCSHKSGPKPHLQVMQCLATNMALLQLQAVTGLTDLNVCLVTFGLDNEC